MPVIWSEALESMIHESSDGVAYAFRDTTKLLVWATEDLTKNVYNQDKCRQSVFTSSLQPIYDSLPVLLMS